MKRYIFLAFCITMLAFSACSKSKKDEAPASKTVDLGETAADKDDNAQKDSKKPNRRNKFDKVPDKEAFKKNEAARFDENGESKRGPSAAEAEFNENQAKVKAEKAKAPAKAKEQAKADDAKADENAAEPFDFSDEVVEEAPKKEIRPPRTPKPQNALDIEKLINIRELREQTGYSGALSEAWLLGQTPHDKYNVMRLATDNTNQLGFSVQVWKPGNESAASKRFNDLYQQSFGGKKIKSVATDAFTASHHNINELGFFEKSKRAAVLLSCSSDVCTPEQLQAVALIIQRRL